MTIDTEDFHRRLAYLRRHTPGGSKGAAAYKALVRSIDAQIEERDARIVALEKLRPHWAKGYTDDGVAAQCATNALQTLWDLLRAKNQTEAVAELHKLLRMAYEKHS